MIAIKAAQNTNPDDTPFAITHQYCYAKRTETGEKNSSIHPFPKANPKGHCNSNQAISEITHARYSATRPVYYIYYITQIKSFLKSHTHVTVLQDQ